MESLLPITALFDRFLDDITLTATEYAAARSAAQAVARTLRSDEEGPAAPEDWIAGSVGKRTAIHPLDSIDLFFRLPAQDSAVTALQTRLLQSFPTATIRADGFLVASANHQVLVRPMIDRQGQLSIPTAEGWSGTNPAAEMAALRIADSLVAGQATALLLLLKAWRRHCEASLEPFALELLAREFASERGPHPWPGLVSDFFAWSRQRTPASFDCPGGQLQLTIGDSWHGQAEAAYWRAVLANRPGIPRSEVIGHWQSLFGPNFGAPRKFNLWNVQPDLGPSAPSH